jgi:hypothetical protein
MRGVRVLATLLFLCCYVNAQPTPSPVPPPTTTLYHGYTSPITDCSTTSFNATQATENGGVYPYNTGDSPACMAWKLAATICNTAPV